MEINSSYFNTIDRGVNNTLAFGNNKVKVYKTYSFLFIVYLSFIIAINI
nr:MAG TPA: hypothetical protein [Caudoviricetes sp.]